MAPQRRLGTPISHASIRKNEIWRSWAETTVRFHGPPGSISTLQVYSYLQTFGNITNIKLLIQPGSEPAAIVVFW